MKISARNWFDGTVAKVEDGAVNGVVRVKINGAEITSVITMNAIADLGLKEGSRAAAIIKASDVMIATGDIRISARNVIPGKVKSVEEGAVNGIVTLATEVGDITASITKKAIADLGLKEGVPASAVVKASHVLIMSI